MFKNIVRCVLYVFKPVPHQFYSAKPTRDTHNRVHYVFSLHDTQHGLPRPTLTVVVFGLKHNPVVGDPGRKCIMSCLGVFFIALESREKFSDVFSIVYLSDTDTIFTTSVFDDLFTQNKSTRRSPSVTKIKGVVLFRHNMIIP